MDHDDMDFYEWLDWLESHFDPVEDEEEENPDVYYDPDEEEEDPHIFPPPGDEAFPQPLQPPPLRGALPHAPDEAVKSPPVRDAPPQVPDEAVQSHPVRDAPPQAPDEVVQSPLLRDAPKRTFSPSCPLCDEPAPYYGPHHHCCLPCGHTFGLQCLIDMLAFEMKCPVCGEVSGTDGIRRIYVHP